MKASAAAQRADASPGERRARQLIARVVGQLEDEGRPEEARARARELEDELNVWLAELAARRPKP